jgi:hypothetical protein
MSEVIGMYSDYFEDMPPNVSEDDPNYLMYLLNSQRRDVLHVIESYIVEMNNYINFKVGKGRYASKIEPNFRKIILSYLKDIRKTSLDYNIEFFRESQGYETNDKKSILYKKQLNHATEHLEEVAKKYKELLTNDEDKYIIEAEQGLLEDKEEAPLRMFAATLLTAGAAAALYFISSCLRGGKKKSTRRQRKNKLVGGEGEPSIENIDKVEEILKRYPGLKELIQDQTCSLDPKLKEGLSKIKEILEEVVQKGGRKRKTRKTRKNRTKRRY